MCVINDDSLYRTSLVLCHALQSVVSGFNVLCCRTSVVCDDVSVAIRIRYCTPGEPKVTLMQFLLVISEARA